MNVVMTYPFSLDVSGGGPSDCIATAMALARQGIGVTLLPVQTQSHDAFPRRRVANKDTATDVHKMLRDAGVRVCPVRRSSLHFILDAAKVRKQVAGLIASHRVDAVISYWQEGRGISRLVQKRGVKSGVVAAASYRRWLHGSSEHSVGRNSLKQFVKSVTVAPYRRYFSRPLHRLRSQRIVGEEIRQADFVVARSEYTRQEVIDLFSAEPAKVNVAYCGISESFLGVRRDYRDVVNHLLYIGALVRGKGVFDALQAFSEIPRSSAEDLKLRIAGWGDESKVRKQAAELGVAHQVEVLGGLSRAELIEQLQWADLAITPSYAESFGLAIAEAQATGLAVLAYKAGAVPEVVESGVTGWLADTGNVGRLTELLAKLVVEPATVHDAGRAAAKRASGRYSWALSAERITQSIQAGFRSSETH